MIELKTDAEILAWTHMYTTAYECELKIDKMARTLNEKANAEKAATLADIAFEQLQQRLPGHKKTKEPTVEETLTKSVESLDDYAKKLGKEMLASLQAIEKLSQG